MIEKTTDCTACGACVQACPKHCISLKEDLYGFLYPVVEAKQCVSCNRCSQVCHLNSDQKYSEKTTEAYACIHVSRDILRQSTSGGVFTAIAEQVLDYNGTVYGCAYVNSLIPRHLRIESRKELSLLRGSKYVQSEIGNAYRDVLADLETGRSVLFTGTPCQIAGLKAFLKKEYENLLTADIICHGVPSYAYFKKFIQWYEKRNRVKVQSFDFRAKENGGWSLAGLCRVKKGNKIFKKKIFYYDSYYYHYFLEGEIYRSSCYQCRYATQNRTGDFTLGDFWGAEGVKLPFDVQGGCSLILANTEKAKKLLRKLPLRFAPVSMAYAIKNNAQLQEPSTVSVNRQIILEEYKNCSAQEIQKRYKRRYRIKRYKAKLKYMIPKGIKNRLLAIRYRQSGKA